MKDPLIRMENIYKWFGKTYALKGVNFKIDDGETVGLVGSNGAGKSTLVKILSGNFPPDKGEIYFKGRRIEIRTPKDAINLGIETVHQDYSLIDERNVAQNLFLGREITKSIGPIKLLDMKRMKTIAMEKTKELGLNIPSSDQEIRFFSGGEKQGIAIARVMYFKAKLVILDEPTTALSIKGCRQVLKFVAQLKERGVATIFITHSINHVYPIADRFVVLSHGKVIKDIKKESTSIEEIEELLARS